MITLQDIIKNSKQHSVSPKARQTRIKNKNYIFSIVGGARGLYGDFVEDFEVAVINPENGDFITSFLIPNADDVVGYMSSEKLVELVNSYFFENDFQFL
jgi:hypothetical protein